MSTYAQFKKASTSNFDKLTSQLQKLNNNTQQNSRGDDRFWKPEVDKAGNGYAVIRFLPNKNPDDIPFVRIWDHGFQGPGGWYIENSLTTINQDDPVSEYNSKLWNSGNEKDKDIARKQKRRLSFYANILVLKDPAHPENEGKVFVYKFGKKIYDKINDLMNPQFQDEQPVNPFDIWNGADFKLKIRNFEGYRNYDKSEFDSPSTLFDGDDNQIESVVFENLHNVNEFVDPKNFKSYDELKVKLYRVLALDGGSHAPAITAEDDEPVMDFTPSFKEREAPSMAETPSRSSSVDDDDDDLSFFKKLAEDD